MKYLYTIIALLLFNITNSYSQVSTQKLPDIDGGNFFSVVEFQDTLYTISIDSEVFTSADNGATWVKDERFNQGWAPAFSVEQAAYLTVDEHRNQLYVYGSFGMMIYSSGTVSVPENLPEFFGSKGAFGEIVVSDSALYASYRYSVSSQGEIMKSIDGGSTWSSHDASNKYFTHLSSTSDGKLLGASGKNLFLSESGGTTFTELTIPSEFIDRITDILVVDDVLYISLLDNGVQSSSDFGENWTQVHTENAFSLTELSDDRILAGGLNGHVYTTSDGGSNWSDTDLGVTSGLFAYQGIKDVIELEDGTLVATSVWGDVYNNVYKAASVGMYVSNDGGTTWVESNTGLAATLISQVFVDEPNDDIYIYSLGKGVLKLDSESSSWVPVGTSPDVTSLSDYSTATTGWFPIGDAVSLSKNVTDNELVLVSTKVTLVLNNETDAWDVVEHDPVDFLSPQNLSFTSDGTAIVHESLGPFQGLYTSTDYSNWTKIENDINSTNISNFSYIDGYMAFFDNYAADGGIGVHYSSDLGATWSHIQENIEGSYFGGGYFMDPVKKEILTTISTYPKPTYQLTSTIQVLNLETKDTTQIAFSSAEEINLPNMKNIYRLPNGTIVTFVYQTDQTTYIEGPLGYFYSSGDTFSKLEADLPEGIADEVVISGDNSLIIQFGNDLYKVEFEEMGTSIYEEVAANPSSFELLPNYPNPFNPSTQLQFELNQPSYTKITVYSTTGQVVKEIDMGKIASGLHSVRFDASSLASGIYLYSVQSGSQIRTGKMTLVK